MTGKIDSHKKKRRPAGPVIQPDPFALELDAFDQRITAPVMYPDDPVQYPDEIINYDDINQSKINYYDRSK